MPRNGQRLVYISALCRQYTYLKERRLDTRQWAWSVTIEVYISVSVTESFVGLIFVRWLPWTFHCSSPKRLHSFTNVRSIPKAKIFSLVIWRLLWWKRLLGVCPKQVDCPKCLWPGWNLPPPPGITNPASSSLQGKVWQLRCRVSLITLRYNQQAEGKHTCNQISCRTEYILSFTLLPGFLLNNESDTNCFSLPWDL